MLRHIFFAIISGLALVGNCQSADAQTPGGSKHSPGDGVGDHIPDIVGSNRLDQAWGSLQIAAAAHEVHGLYYGADAGPGYGFAQFGAGVSLANLPQSGNFFGPGTGNGLTLMNDGWSASSLVFSGGLYRTFGLWYGGINVNFTTPGINSPTASGITSNGIPVTSTIVQSGLSFDVMGRVGYNTYPYPALIFIEGGVNVTNYNAAITAPSVGDLFTESRTLTRPMVGGGLDFNLCPAVVAPTQGLCPHLELEGTHIFGDQSWLLGVTPLSSGEGTLRGTTRVSAKLVIPVGLVVFDGSKN